MAMEEEVSFLFGVRKHETQNQCEEEEEEKMVMIIFNG